MCTKEVSIRMCPRLSLDIQPNKKKNDHYKKFLADTQMNEYILISVHIKMNKKVNLIMK